MKKQQKTTIWRFYSFTKGYRWRLVCAALCTVFGVCMSFFVPQVIKVTVDSIIGDLPFALPQWIVQIITAIGGKEWLRHHVYVCAVVALALYVLSFLSDYFARKNIANACEGIVKRIRDTLFTHIQHLPYRWHNQNQTGDIIQRCTMDVDLIRNFLCEQLMNLVRTIVILVVANCLMFPMNVTLSLVALSFIPITLAYSTVFYHLTAKRFTAADECEGALTSLVQENLTGVRVVRAFGRERYELDRFLQKNDEFSQLWVELGHVLGLNWGTGDFVSFMQVVVIALCGAYLAVRGDITAGEFLTFVSYNTMLIWPIRNLGRILSELSKTTVSSVRLFDILDAEQEQDCETPNDAPMQGDIVFDHVTFGYLPSGETLKDVSFTIKQGTTLGILGATGSGKSTLMYLLDRLYDLPPENGRITIGGVDIRDMSRKHLRSQIGIVLQEPFLFSKSFHENIADGSSDRSLDTVRQYARLAFIDDTIASFQDGYDTQIGERGVTISGGQKQRVAIARMLMQNTPIKIFDDSLSAVDMETDAKIRASIQQNVKGTTIIIAHRITTIMNADHIIVMDRGRVAQSGTHAQLIATQGIYQKIYDTQKSTQTNEGSIACEGM